MKKSIAIDMDDTIADTLLMQIEWYENKFGIKITKQDTYGKQIYDVVVPEHKAIVQSFLHHPDFFKNLNVFEGAQDVIYKLSKKYDIFIASAAMEFPTSFNAKFEWLKKNFPFINEMNYIFCGYKYFLNCDYLIDDNPCHIDTFRGKGFLYSAEHNIYETKYHRVKNWNEIETILS